MQEIFTILRQRASLERPTFPVNPLLFRVPAPCLAAILDCRTLHCILWVLQETFLNDCSRRTNIYSLQRFKERPDTAGNTKRPESEMRREPRNSLTPVPRFQSGGGLWKHTGGTYSHGAMIDYPRIPISRLDLGNVRTPWNFKAGKSTSRLKYVFWSAFPHLTMHWIKVVEIAKSTDERMTSRSILERTDFPGYDMLDAMIASALKKLLDKHVHFRKRVSVEEQRAQK